MHLFKISLQMALKAPTFYFVKWLSMIKVENESYNIKKGLKRNKTHV